MLRERDGDVVGDPLERRDETRGKEILPAVAELQVSERLPPAPQRDQRERFEFFPLAPVPDHQAADVPAFGQQCGYAVRPERPLAGVPRLGRVGLPRDGVRRRENLSVVGSWLRNIRPTLINDFRYTHGNRYNVVRAAGTGSGKNGELGIPGVDSDRFPRINVAGISSLGSSAQQRIQTPILTEQLVDTHHLGQGAARVEDRLEFRYSRNQDNNTPTTGGLFAFNERATANGVAALLLGYVNNAQLVSTDTLNSRSDYYGAFVQDDWKVSTVLTLNIGLRWDMDTPRSELTTARAVLTAR